MSSDRLICCKNIETFGNIAFSQGCVIHPHCKIAASNAPIVFGEYNIIEERVKIINVGANNSPSTESLQIGHYNCFEVGTTVENCKIGNCNLFGHRCYISHGCVIGNGCVIVAGVVVPPGTVIPDATVVYGNGQTRRNIVTEDLTRQNIRGLYEVLKRHIPKYNATSSNT